MTQTSIRRGVMVRTARIAIMLLGLITPSILQGNPVIIKRTSAVRATDYITIGSNGPSTETSPNTTRTVMFSIYWTGNTTSETSWMYYSVTCTGAVTCTAVSDVDLMSKSHPVLDIYVTYTTAGTGAGAVTVTADGNIANTEYSIPVNLPAAFAVTANESEVTVPSTGSANAGFLVSNSSGSTQIYSLSCTGPQYASVSCPSTVTVGGGSSGGVQVTISGLQSDGNVTLSATLSGTTRSASVYAREVIVEYIPTVMVSRVGAALVRLPANKTGNTAQFTVANGATAESYAFNCSGCVSVAPTSASMSAGQSTAATVTFSTGSPGLSWLWFTASGNASATDSIQIRSGGAIAQMTATSPLSAAASSASNQASVSMSNSGVGTDEYTITCTPSGAVTACAKSDQNKVALPYNGSANFTINYSTGSGTSGSMYVSATSPSGNASFTIAVNVGGSGGGGGGLIAGVPTVALDTIRTLDRSDCVTTSAGPAGTFQCGDLLFAHAMPAYKALNEDRRLTLVYNSATANMQQVLIAHVGLGSTTLVPDEVRTTLRMTTPGGTQTWTFKYTGSSFASGQSRQVSMMFDASGIGTGLYAYEMEVTNLYGSTPYTTTKTGEIVLVDRKRAQNTPFGAGWAVGGHSQLYVGQSGRNAVLIVEADGSYATYDSVAANKYRAPAGAYRDTVELGTFNVKATGDSTYYRQRDLDGTERYFDVHGRLRWIADKRDHHVQFTYSAPHDAYSRLATIRIAPWEMNRYYAFAYDGAYKLDNIIDPSGWSSRIMDVNVDASNQLTEIRDPGLTASTFFRYVTGTNLVASWQSPRGHVFNYTYHQDRGLLTNVITPVDTISMVPSQLNGIALAGASSPVPAGLDLGKVVIRGPRNVGDTAAFHVNKWGAVTSFVDAFGNTTSISRNDASFPLLPSVIVQPNGARKVMTYDAVGRVIMVRDSTLGLTNGLPTTVTEYEYVSSYNRAAPTAIIRRGSTYDDTTKISIYTNGLPYSVTYPNGRVTTFMYEMSTASYRGSLVWVYENPVTTWENGTKVRRALTTYFDYDAYGNLNRQRDPADITRKYLKDAIGRDTATTLHISPWEWNWVSKQSVTYNAFNQMLSSKSHPLSTDSAGSILTTTYAYAQDVLSSVTDPRSVPVRSYSRDHFNRVTAETDDYGKADRTEYDESGNVTRSIPRTYLGTSLSIDMRYDRGNRLEAKKWAGRDGNPADSVVYQYDNMGRMVEARTFAAPGNLIQREYYANGLLKKEVQMVGTNSSTHQYEYDRFGRRTKYTMGGAEQDVITYTYPQGDTIMKVAVQWRDADTNVDSVIIRFDQLGRRDSVSYYVHGAAHPTHVSYAYDLRGVMRRVCAKHQDSSGTFADLLNFKWSADTVDVAGRVVFANAYGDSSCPGSPELVFSRWNGYDGHGRLVTQRTLNRSEFRYDGSGNMITREQWYPNNVIQRRSEFQIASGHNRMNYYSTKYRTFTKKELAVTYDSSGSRLEETPTGSNADSALTQYRGYYYDGLNRLTGTRHYNLAKSSSLMYSTRIEHLTGLDGDARLFNWGDGQRAIVDSVRMTTATLIDLPSGCRYDPLGRMYDPCDNGAVSLLSFDGHNVVRTGDDRSDTSLPRFSFVHGPGVDDPLLGRKETEKVIFITNGQGEVFSTARADGFDTTKRFATDNPSLAGGIRNATAFDNESPGAVGNGLSYYRNRFYDAGTGRWTQEDPIGVAGGVNLYAYGSNDPSTYTDLFGLAPCPPHCSPIQYASDFVFSAWNHAGARTRSILGRVAMFGTGKMGMIEGKVERDLAGRHAVRVGPQVSGEAMSAAAGIEVTLMNAPKSSVAVSAELPIGIRTKSFGAGAAVTASGAVDHHGHFYVTSVGVQWGASLGRSRGREGVGVTVTPPLGPCTGTRCDK